MCSARSLRALHYARYGVATASLQSQCIHLGESYVVLATGRCESQLCCPRPTRQRRAARVILAGEAGQPCDRTHHCYPTLDPIQTNQCWSREQIRYLFIYCTSHSRENRLRFWLIVAIYAAVLLLIALAKSPVRTASGPQACGSNYHFEGE